jgi:hypothetical protein
LQPARWQTTTIHAGAPKIPTRGTHQVDVTSVDSVRTLFAKVSKADAIVATTGRLHFGPPTEMTFEQFQVGLHDKLLGQVHLALVGQHCLNEGGSIALASGIVSEEPMWCGRSNALHTAAEIFSRRSTGESIKT